MSLQDDIFDLRHALKRKPAERAALDRLCTQLYQLEELTDQQNKILVGLSDGIDAIKALARIGK